MNESNSSSPNERVLLSMTSVLLIGVYFYPVLTMTSLYTTGHLPYILMAIFVIAGWSGQWVQHKLPTISEKTRLFDGVQRCLWDCCSPWSSQYYGDFLYQIC